MEAPKVRRTKQQLEDDIINALERLLHEHNMSDIPLLTLAKEAKVDPNAFYRRFGTMDNLYDQFVGKYDLWMNEVVNITDIRSQGAEKFYAEALKALFKALLHNNSMQKILLWELSFDNPTTRKTASTRAALNMGFMVYYSNLFKHTGIDIGSLTTLFISGIYYLVLHRNHAASYLVDLNTHEGQEKVCKAIDTLVGILFEAVTQKEKLRNTILKMENDKIPHNKICDYLGISTYQLKKALR